MKNIKRLFVLVTVLAVAFTLVSCGKKEGQGVYTYNSYSTALGKNWNPHTWETNAESSILSYIETPFVDMSILDSENGVYQWVYEMATAVTDVTKDHKDDLTKYNVALPAGVTDANEVEEGYVYEIKLRESAKWQDGTPINADTYIKSMQYLLAFDMHNYRANLYLEGESALAGAYEYYYQGENYGSAHNEYATWDAVKDPATIFFHWGADEADNTSFLSWLWGNYADHINSGSYGANELEFINNAFSGGPFFEDTDALMATLTEMNGKSYKEISENEKWNAALQELFSFWISKPNEEELDFFATTFIVPPVSFDKVGLYKVNDYTIRYVNKNQINKNYFLTSLTSNWIVYEPLYTASFDNSGKLKTTKYGTSVETTMSYGPYILESFQAEKQMVFAQNENWYGYTKDEDGNLYSETEFLVDNKHVRQYQTSRVVINVMDDATAKQSFMKGELDDWAPSATELSEYTTSSQLYQVDETYQMSFFFNTNVDALKTMDESKGNQNSVVLSNINFRKAFSLAIDRSEWVTATAGYKAAYSLLNSLYYYDIYENPASSYRNTDQAKRAIVGLYGVEYGEGKAYATLDEAYKAINGYNLTEAKKLMKQACDELVAAGLYTAGQEIKIRIGYKKGALESDDNAQVALMNKYLNAAVEGSGFGKVTLEAVGNVADRYGDVPKGEFAIGYGAWGGAAFYPFRNFQVYMDPDQYGVNEVACWNPKVETLTLNVGGEDVTMTYQKWSNSMVGNGQFANADFETQLDILSQLEQDYLSKYYRIPLASSTSCSMLSYKLNYYTEAYNIMYGFGGIRLMTYNYDDAEWAKYVKKQGGSLNYAG